MNDEKIIAAIRRGDERAIDRVMDKYSRLMWSIASAVLKNTASVQDVEECVADVFIYLWQNPEKYDPERGGLKAWLSAVARSRAVDRYRELLRRRETPLDEELPVEQLGIAEGLAAQETRQALNAAVRALEEPDREILIRRYYYEQKPREIALATGLTVTQVNNSLYRSKRQLRQALAEKGAGV